MHGPLPKLALAALIACGGAAAATRASATEDYARRTGQGCSTCHAGGSPSGGNLTGAGSGFAGCNGDFACIADWSASMRGPAPQNGGSGGYSGGSSGGGNASGFISAAPNGQRLTSENYGGLAEIGNKTACPGGKRVILVRPGRDEAARDVGLILEPGQSVKLVVSKRSTWAAACDKAPDDSGKFSWVPLTLAQ